MIILRSEEVEEMNKQIAANRTDITFLLQKDAEDDALFKQHSAAICDYLAYKKTCEDFHRRKGEEQVLMADAVKVLAEEVKVSSAVAKRNAEALELIADIMTTYKTGKRALPILAVIAGWLVIAGVLLTLAWASIQESIHAVYNMIKW